MVRGRADPDTVPYTFMIGPTGEFGIREEQRVPLHASIEGWLEALALAYCAAVWAKQITTVTGDGVDGIELGGHAPVGEVMGLADTWWRGTDSLVAIYTGEARCFSDPEYRTAVIYSGINDWNMRVAFPDADGRGRRGK